MHAHFKWLLRPLSSRSYSAGLTPERLHPSVRNFALELAQIQPCFPISSKQVSVLSQPQEFYDLLLNMIRRAQKRIFISSLYIGETEEELIQELSAALEANPALQLHLHLDYNRSTRPGPTSTAHLLLPLIKSHSGRVHVRLFKSPKLKGFMAKVVPRRFDEGWGTWHAKVYGVDDELIISGANLNQSYFTNRQDRYLHLKSAPIAQYCFSFLRTMDRSCFSLSRAASSFGPPYELKWQDPTTHHEQIEATTGASLQSFQENQLQLSRAAQEKVHDEEIDAWIYPMIQGGQFGIREEERTLSLLFKHMEEQSNHGAAVPLMDLTSGYFCLYEKYQELVRLSNVDCRILIASPLANGFYGSQGISGRIPEGYTFLEQRFWAGVRQYHREWQAGSEKPGHGHGVLLSEYTRPGWTYHAKGIWLSPDAHSPPVLTTFGSSNLNSRSAHIDTELGFVLVASDTASSAGLRARLKDEVEMLRSHSGEWKGEERKVRIGTRFMVGLVGGML